MASERLSRSASRKGIGSHPRQRGRRIQREDLLLAAAGCQTLGIAFMVSSPEVKPLTSQRPVQPIRGVRVLPARVMSRSSRISSDSVVRASIAVAAMSVAGQRLAKRKSRLARVRCKGAAEASRNCPASVTGEEMPGRYESAKIEEDLYSWWESSGFFKPEIAEEVPRPGSSGDRESYVMPMPPPNVTGRLHMGHAMFASLEDVLARFHRMRGDRTLWLPGTDHAGIATQMLVERQLVSEGTSRKEVGREEFLKRVWEWKAEKGGAIVDQLRRLGSSADWSREQFTLDDHLSAAVVEAFCRLHEMGVISRGKRMVNWSPVLQTAVSDLEVEFSDFAGTLYNFKYVVAGDDGQPTEEFIPVATTRPETILGDSAVCVHPEDDRYKHLVGRKVLVPMQGRTIPVIADDYVDREFGTGALKITPAHDFNDFEIAQRHDLAFHTVIGLDGAIAPTAEFLGSPQYVGLSREKCRKKLWADMEEEGLVIKAEDHQQRIPLSQRSGEVIEPMLSDQWFCSTEVMAQRALDVVESGEVSIQPDRFVKTWQGWLKEKQPWCISRQLWWGHRIPVWYPSNRPGNDKYFVARSEEEAYEKARAELGEDVELKQDDDVLDTWFSSGLWPFATVGWPDESSEDYQKYYPATMMETGYDILFFWVARMVMMGLTLTDKAPFKEIYLHGLVRDEKGQKMSKTKGNVVDPLESIAEYGTDALRYALLTNSVAGMDTPVSKGMLENAKAFANKIWNVGRFIITEHAKTAESMPAVWSSGMTFSEEEIKQMPWVERSLLSKCNAMCDSVTSALLANRFAAPTKELKEFLQDDVASWYVEVAKTRFQEQFGGNPGSPEAATSQKVLLYLLEVSLKMLHPFMPFVTEAVWQRLPLGDSPPKSLMISSWPVAAGQSSSDLEAEGWFTKFCSMVTAIRNARAEQGVKPKERLPLTLWCKDAKFQGAMEAEGPALAWLSRADPQQLKVCAMSEQPSEMPEGTVRVLVGDDLEVDILVPKVEVDIEKELQRLQKQLDQVTGYLQTTEKKISPQFLERAAPAVKEKTLAQQDELRQQKESLTSQIAELKGDAEPSRREFASAVAAFLLGGGAVQPAKAEDIVYSLEGPGIQIPGLSAESILPAGAKQEARFRKWVKAWKDLPPQLEKPEDAQKTWDNCQGFLRRIYGVNEDMNYIAKGFKDASKKTKAEETIETFKKKIKAADKPAKAKDLPAFMVFHAEILGLLKQFESLTQDAVEDLTTDEAEQELEVNFT
eukprot:CAMPEP_0197630132 /NCGR_PEP_ID=MMETSP1338-20131121/7713_1 /TAXON_ID=43686 ORGANISM="Pelagodinium beii, Strain RCC1491" /NCGR_SAMPLE_ID=MMETSP1338 /ASSEMBLY_ACC=CAM_ASM_000754 /LENGTH=1247 /DNA_ID=CAMNT_0043201285 /DNA_START=33 /DNA_END=3776 /DNA_ORIENTATION=+